MSYGQNGESVMRFYLLQLIFNDEVGTIKSVNVTKSLYVANRWFHKRLKTSAYTHGYQELEL